MNELTLSFYLRSIAWHIADLPIPASEEEAFRREAEPFIAGADPQTALMAVGVISVLALILSAGIIHRRQWPLTEGV